MITPRINTIVRDKFFSHFLNVEYCIFANRYDSSILLAFIIVIGYEIIIKKQYKTFAVIIAGLFSGNY